MLKYKINQQTCKSKYIGTIDILLEEKKMLNIAYLFNSHPYNISDVLIFTISYWYILTYKALNGFNYLE